MAHEPILILDPNPTSRAQLTEILTGGGYDVYGAKSADRLVEAVRASPFPAVMIDLWLPNIDRGALVQAIREASPQTAVIVMGEKQVFSWLLEVFREGAADFVLKPYDPIEVRQRVDLALARRQHRLEQARAAQVSSSHPSVTHPKAGIIELLESVREFQEQSLEVFLDLERKNLDLERQIAALKDPTTHGELSRSLKILVAHPDPALSDGLRPVVSSFHSRLESQAFTGGEVLDRLGDTRIDVLLLSSDLPDIPGSIVASSVKSEYRNVEVLLLETNEEGDTELHIVTEGAAENPKQPVTSQQDLINVVKARCRHCRERQEARQFAHEFKGRHQEYIHSLANLKSRIEKALEELF